jgi:two-component sensor histidine kinase
VFALRLDKLSAQLALAIAAVTVAFVATWALARLLPGVKSTSLYMPAILLASLIGGVRSGVAAAVLALVASMLLLSARFGVQLAPDPRLPIDLTLFALAAGAVVVGGSYARWLYDSLRRNRDELDQRSLHYRNLFETMTEGYAVCEAIRDEHGKLVDYTVVEMNSALQRMLGVGAEAIGSRLSDTPIDWGAWLQICEHVLNTGSPFSFERQNRPTRQWHEVRVSRLSRSTMAQFFFEITARKAAETRQSELFDELNHRVKNNLAMVAGLLQLQARESEPAVAGELLKAATRVHSIAEVHSALSRETQGDEVEFGGYLEDLCEGLARSPITEDRVELTVEAQSAVLPVDTAISLGMVVNELVTNAAKYAYPHPDRGRIEVGFRRDDAVLVLSVSDFGRGLPPEAQGRGGGLGMRLVRSLADQTGAELIVTNEGGARFEIRLPAAPPRESAPAV